MTSKNALRRENTELALKATSERQAGVVCLRQLYGLGVTRAQARANVSAKRWRRVGRQCVVLHTGELSTRAQEWVAVLDAGPRACLDGASSLVAAGLKNYTVDRIRVSLPRGAKVVRSRAVDVRQTRRLQTTDVVDGGIPRTRNEVAAVRAGLWAVTDSQAGLVLSMSVQQRLTSASDLAGEMMRIKRDRRRMLLNELVIEIGGGAESLGEIDVAFHCRERGLPEPTRQSVRRASGRRFFLDIEWKPYGVVLEIDGIQHAWAQNIVGDALRQNELAIGGSLVLRLPLAGLRFAPDEFFAQVEAALRTRGWQQISRAS